MGERHVRQTPETEPKVYFVAISLTPRSATTVFMVGARSLMGFTFPFAEQLRVLLCCAVLSATERNDGYKDGRRGRSSPRSSSSCR